MSQLYVQPVAGLLTAANPAATLPVPSASTDGVDISTWRKGVTPIGYQACIVMLDADGASTLTGPVNIYGWSPYAGTGGRWRLIGSLFKAANVALTATVGYDEQINFPCVFTRLCVAATVSANNVSHRYLPVALHNG